MQDKTNGRKKEIITTLGVLVVIAVMVILVSVTSKKSSGNNLATSAQGTTKTSGTTTAKAPNASNTQSTTTAATYKDGTYMANGSYESPGGQEGLTVSLTISGGKVSDSSVKSGATDDEAQAYQSQFISGYKKLVIGKPISSLKLSSVSGSSLTSRGFNAAVSKIKQQAQA